VILTSDADLDPRVLDFDIGDDDDLYDAIPSHLQDAGFFASLADPCIWMLRVDDHCEHIAVYEDDLAIALKDPAGVASTLLGRRVARDRDVRIF
jgi:hypothetical protein